MKLFVVVALVAAVTAAPLFEELEESKSVNIDISGHS